MFIDSSESELDMIMQNIEFYTCKARGEGGGIMYIPSNEK